MVTSAPMAFPIGHPTVIPLPLENKASSAADGKTIHSRRDHWCAARFQDGFSPEFGRPRRRPSGAAATITVDPAIQNQRPVAILKAFDREQNVASAAPLPSLEISHGKSAAAVLLSQLGQAHGELLREMENMDRITRGPIPVTRELAAARWRIGQASLSRRNRSARALAFLAERVGGRDGETLKLLRLENQLATSRSTAHVYGWTIRAISQDWDRYCQASRDIRMQMKANILLEKQSLYPLLERLAGGAR